MSSLSFCVINCWSFRICRFDDFSLQSTWHVGTVGTIKSKSPWWSENSALLSCRTDVNWVRLDVMAKHQQDSYRSARKHFLSLDVGSWMIAMDKLLMPERLDWSLLPVKMDVVQSWRHFLQTFRNPCLRSGSFQLKSHFIQDSIRSEVDCCFTFNNRAFSSSWLTQNLDIQHVTLFPIIPSKLFMKSRSSSIPVEVDSENSISDSESWKKVNKWRTEGHFISDPLNELISVEKSNLLLILSAPPPAGLRRHLILFQ